MNSDLNSLYGLNPAHSEIVEACDVIEPCDVLDMGCSTGRNALYLARRGFNVTAIDNNANAVKSLETIVEREGLSNITPLVYDINSANIESCYGFIACTVTLMFVNAASIPSVLHNMQDQTNVGGYNLIVCAMDTIDYPCPLNFPFTFKEGELRNFYKGWDFIKYNENLGTMHNGAQLQFATLLARKAL